MQIQEVQIKVPWGHLAAKLWGNPEDKPILTVHGLMDNAGSFDGLIPLLPKYFYICIDLPGHGKSSHFPPHLPIHSIDYILVYKLIIEYFKKDKYVIMGHSYGGQLGLLFAQLYPERVEKLIMFDTIHLLTVPTKNFRNYLVSRFKMHLEKEEKMENGTAPLYTYQQALEKIIQVRPYPLTEKAAKSLLKRTLIPAENDKFKLSLDQRLKYVVGPLQDSKYVVATLKESPIQCPVLIMFGLNNNIQRELLRSLLNHMKKQSNFTFKYLPGHHDIHQNDCEIVAPIVAEFLNKQRSKL